MKRNEPNPKFLDKLSHYSDDATASYARYGQEILNGIIRENDLAEKRDEYAENKRAIEKEKRAKRINANAGEKNFSIIDETGDTPCLIGKMNAGNGKQALVKFMRAKGMSAYLYTLDKAKRGAWQLTNALGTTIVAVEA